MKNTTLSFSLLLLLFGMNSCGGSGTILAGKGAFKAVGYPFENPQSQADGRIVATSPNGFILVSHFELDDSVRFVAYSGDSMDILWRTSAPMTQDEEVDYNALYMSGGKLVVFTNRKSNDTVYYSARLVDIRTGKLGESKVLIQATPEEYGNGYLEPYFGSHYGIRREHRFVYDYDEKTYNLFNAVFSPDSSKLLVFAIGKDAIKTEHKDALLANVLILDRNLAVLKSAKMPLLLPTDSGEVKGFAIDNSGNVYLTISHKEGDLITVKQFAMLGDGHVSILRNAHPQNLASKVTLHDVGIAQTKSGKLYVASLFSADQGLFWEVFSGKVHSILSVSQFDFSANAVTSGSVQINGDTVEKLFHESKFDSPKIEGVLAQENIDRIVVLLQQTYYTYGSKYNEDYLGDIVISAHSLAGTPIWLAGIADFEWNNPSIRYLHNGFTTQVTPMNTLRIFHKDGFYLCDEFDLTTGSRLTPLAPANSDEPDGLRLLDLHDVNRFQWCGCRLSENSEVFLSSMPTQNRPMSIVKVTMSK